MQNLGPCPHNIKAGLCPCSPVWTPRYPDDTSTKSTEFCRSTGDSYPNSLHWLPVIYRSKYKIPVYTYKALNGCAPQYLEELAVPYQPTRSLRYKSESLVMVPKMQGVTYSNRCFRKAAATLWNNLPLIFRKCKTLLTFKRKVKTIFYSIFIRKTS